MKSKYAFCMLAIMILMTNVAYAESDKLSTKVKAEPCEGCHGVGGNSVTAIFPKLAGLHENYLIKQMQEFKSGKRVDATMNAMASTLNDEDIKDLAAYFASQEQKIEKSEKMNLEGKQLYNGGKPTLGLPACAACHGINGTGLASAGYPLLRGQFAAYISKTLTDFQQNERNNDMNHIMRDIAKKLSPEEINAIAEYISVFN